MIKSIPLKVLLLDDGGSRMDPVTSDGLLILGFLAVVLAPMALALAETGGGAGWKLLTFLCCAFAAWFLVFASNVLIALVAWALAWACAMAMRISFNRRRARSTMTRVGSRRTLPSCQSFCAVITIESRAAWPSAVSRRK